MRILIIILVSTFILSCNSQKRNLKKENVILNKKNDSLLKILNNLKSKYIFDDIKVRIIPNQNNLNKINSEFKGEFVIVGYNKETVVNFSTKKNESTGVLFEAKELKRDYGGYPFNLILKKTENDIYFKFDINGFYGKDFRGITIKDKVRIK